MRPVRKLQGQSSGVTAPQGQSAEKAVGIQDCEASSLAQGQIQCTPPNPQYSSEQPVYPECSVSSQANCHHLRLFLVKDWQEISRPTSEKLPLGSWWGPEKLGCCFMIRTVSSEHLVGGG